VRTEWRQLSDDADGLARNRFVAVVAGKGDLALAKPASAKKEMDVRESFMVRFVL
jgi:hypothetical protein